MLNIKLSEIRNPSILNNQTELLHILDGRKNEEVGYFIPKALSKEFESFIFKIERDKHLALLKKVAKTQKQDPIGDGAVDDGSY